MVMEIDYAMKAQRLLRPTLFYRAVSLKFFNAGVLYLSNATRKSVVHEALRDEFSDECAWAVRLMAVFFFESVAMRIK